MIERELVDLFEKYMIGIGYRCEKIDHPTSQKGWDIIMTKGDEKVGVEAKYFKGPKVSSLGSFMISMLSTRNSDINDIFWLFNADRDGHTDKYIKYEYMIYFAEQIADYKKGKYWKPFLQDIKALYIYDGRKRCFYRCTPDEYKDLSEKWSMVIQESDFEPYLMPSKKLNEKVSLFEEKFISKLVREGL